MSSRDVPLVPPARQWWTLVPFIAAVTVVAGVGGLAASGQGVSTDIIEAAALAYLRALSNAELRGRTVAAEAAGPRELTVTPYTSSRCASISRVDIPRA